MKGGSEQDEVWWDNLSILSLFTDRFELQMPTHISTQYPNVLTEKSGDPVSLCFLLWAASSKLNQWVIVV